MPLIITDTNIFIDIKIGGLTAEIFEIEETLAVADVMFAEELEQHHPELPEHGLEILELTPEQIGQATLLKQKYNGPGMNDLFALVLALEHEVPLLSGDDDLRKAAKDEDVEVRGTLWLIDALIVQEIITVERASNAYDAMKLNGRRLPWKKIVTQLKKYQ